jgi:HEAT repeats
MVALFLDKKFNRPVDENLPEFQPVRQFEADAAPFLIDVLTNRTDTGIAAHNRQERQRACAALGLLDADLWTNQPAAEKRLLAKELVSAYTEEPAQSLGETQEAELLAIRRIGPDAVPFLMDVIRAQTNAPEMRIMAYWALGRLRAPPEIVVPFLAEQFNTNKELLGFAGDALIRFGAEARRAIPTLTNAFHSPDFMLAKSAAFVLAKVYPDDADLAPTMSEWLKSTNVVHRRFAAEVLVDMGVAAKPAASALADGARDPDQTVRENSLRALDQLEKAAAGHAP